MIHKVSKDYPRLKQLLDSGHCVVCWERMSLQFIDPDYERNTLDLEDVSYKEWGGK